jgi:CheB methylesterase
MNTPRAPEDFPVVCVGGSAGGLQAYVTLLQNLPVDLGIAVVIVNHMRSAATTFHKILPRYTTMPVELITERLVIEPNRVYIIPENREPHILEGTFRLSAIFKAGGRLKNYRKEENNDNTICCCLLPGSPPVLSGSRDLIGGELFFKLQPGGRS